MTVLKSLKTTPPGFIKPQAKSYNSKVNRGFNLRAKKWGMYYLSIFDKVYLRALCPDTF